MSIESVKKFYDKVLQDKGLRDRIEKASAGLRNDPALKAAAKGNSAQKDAFLRKTYDLLKPFAVEAGTEFTWDDLQQFQANPPKLDASRELSEEELALASGGGSFFCIIGGGGAGFDGVCVFVGLGSNSHGSTACVLAGIMST